MCSIERVERVYIAKLAYITRCYPQWKIGRERFVWTATYCPTPTALWFIYATSLSELEHKLQQAQIEGKPCI